MNTISPLKTNNISGIMQNNQIGKLNNHVRSTENKAGEKIKELSQEFESLLLYSLMKTMRATVPKNGLLHSHAEDIFTSMLDEEMTKAAAKREDGGLGLAQIMQQQLMNRGNQTLESRGIAKPGSENKKNHQAVFPNNR